jgi:hypothetical protein
VSTKAIEVVERNSGKVVHTVPLADENDAEKVMRGMLINMDVSRYFVREAQS